MLTIKNICKSYKHVQALQHVNLELKEGIYALLGPNGAGKSTFMNIICDQIKADDGYVEWDHQSIQKLGNAYYSILGYAPQQQGLYDEFTGRRFLTYMALLKNIHKKDITKEVTRVADMVNMRQELDKKCKAYSGGMKQRIMVAQALLGNPKLLLFDEPTAGLDPKERVSLRQVFASLAQDHILLIATHVVSDVETITKEVIFLKQGQLIAKGSVEKLLSSYPDCQTLEEVYLTLFQEERQ